MRTELLAIEAAKCRRQAKKFVGRPEQPFLLSIASAFEDLASKDARDEPHVIRRRV